MIEIKQVKQEIKEHKYPTFILFFLGILLFLMPRYIIAPWDNYRFILLSGLPFFCFTYMLFKKKTISVQLISSDVSWLIFISLSFLSFFWAVNGTLVWYHAFGWLSLVLWMILFRIFSFQKNTFKFLPEVFLTFFFMIMAHLLIVSIFGHLRSSSVNWQFHFGYNSNYIASYLISLYPFLLFYRIKTPFIRRIQILSTCFLVYILFSTGAKGAIVAFLFIILYYLWNFISKKHFLYLIGGGTLFLLCLCGIFFYNSNIFLNIPLLKEIGSSGDSTRIYMIWSSFKIFTENPIIGIGLGNWQVEAYKYNLSNIIGFNDPILFYRYGSHNLYGQQLAEFGLFGFIAFLYPFGIILWKGLISCSNMTDLQKAAYASVLVYLITSFFYRDINLYEFHFSGIQLLIFCALGLLTFNNTRFYAIPKWTKVFFTVLAVFSLSWFIVYKYTYDCYIDAQRFSEKKPKKIRLIEDYDSYYEIQRFFTGDKEIIPLIEAIYHPIFKNTHGFNHGHIGYNKSLTLQLAQLYQQEEEFDKSEKYYQLALKGAPYDEHILLSYAKFLLRKREEPSKAKTYALKAYSIQNNHFDTNLLLAEIAITEKSYNEAKYYLKALEGTTKIAYKWLVNLLLAEIAIEENQYEKAKQYLEIFKGRKKHWYKNKIRTLEQRIDSKE